MHAITSYYNLCHSIYSRIEVPQISSPIFQSNFNHHSPWIHYTIIPPLVPHLVMISNSSASNLCISWTLWTNHHCACVPYPPPSLAKMTHINILQDLVSIANPFQNNKLDFFPIENIACLKVILQLRQFAKGMCVSLITTKTFDNLINVMKLQMTFCSHALIIRPLIHWLNRFCPSTRLSQTMSMYFLIVEPLTFKQSTIWSRKTPWANL